MRKFLLIIFCTVNLLLLLISCEKEEDPNNLTNKVEFEDFIVSEISYNTAQVSSKLPMIEGLGIKEYGYCWGLDSLPTLNDSISVLVGNSIDIYETNLSGLNHNSKYYVRTYFKFGNNISYSEPISFKTLEIKVPSVTAELSRVSLEFISVKSIINSKNGGEIISQGICWNTTGAPTINDNVNSEDLGDITYISNIANLTFNTTYYIKAYAENEVGLSYGEELILDYDWGVIQIQDYDGNWYSTVKIGTQIWLKENLRTTHYPDGIPINDGTGLNIDSESSPAYYFAYDDDESNVEVYGRLYTWYAAVEACPDDWHMPTQNEWEYLLMSFIGNESAGKLKSAGTIEDGTGLWKSPNLNGSDDYGFTVVPSGQRSSINSSYGNIGEVGSFLYYNDKFLGHHFTYDYAEFIRFTDTRADKNAYSVRCIKDY